MIRFHAINSNNGKPVIGYVLNFGRFNSVWQSELYFGKTNNKICSRHPKCQVLLGTDYVQILYIANSICHFRLVWKCKHEVWFRMPIADVIPNVRICETIFEMYSAYQKQKVIHIRKVHYSKVNCFEYLHVAYK